MNRHILSATHSLIFSTAGPGSVEITGDIKNLVPELFNGLVTLFIRHTSASLLIQENADPEVQTDLEAFFERLVPRSDHPSMAYLTHTYEGPDDMPAHIKAALLPTCLTIPVVNGRLGLGRWQGIFLLEHRDGPNQREVLCHLC